MKVIFCKNTNLIRLLKRGNTRYWIWDVIKDQDKVEVEVKDEVENSEQGTRK